MNSISKPNVRFGTQSAALFCLAGLIAVAGCDVNFGIRGSGVAKSEIRTVNEFDQIELDGAGTLNISFADAPSLKVQADDNLLEFIKTDVQDRILKISFSESVSPRTTTTFDVALKSLKRVAVSGAAKIAMKSAKLQDFSLKISGAGNFVGDGEAESVALDISGAADVDISELRAKSVQVTLSGAGQVDAYASESLDARVSGTGFVTCSGNPKTVNKKVDGIGRINVTSESTAEKPE
jgi:hypothetical protein